MTMSSWIPGAHSVIVSRYDDLTTNNPVIGALSESCRILLCQNDYSNDGLPKKMAWYTPKQKVPGIEISGMIEDSRFVIRIPDQWNEKLVCFVAGGVSSERDGDAAFSDFVLTNFDDEGNSYAYVGTDKGTVGEIIPAPDGNVYPLFQAVTALVHESDNLLKWSEMLKKTTVAAKEVLKRYKGQEVRRTYLVGVSNGGYTGRYAMENFDDLYDGMVDWEGVLWRADEHNFVSSFNDAIKAWNILQDDNASQVKKDIAHKVFVDFGFQAGSERILEHYATLWYLLALNMFRMVIDPEYLHCNWWGFFSGSEDYKDYDYFQRLDIVKERVASFENTGRIKKPVITVFGDWDYLTFYPVHGKKYEELVKSNGDFNKYRLYTVQHATHLDSLVGHPEWDPQFLLQPLLPYAHQAFNLLTRWVEAGIPAPTSKTIPMVKEKGKVIDIIDHKEILPYQCRNK